MHTRRYFIEKLVKCTVAGAALTLSGCAAVEAIAPLESVASLMQEGEQLLAAQRYDEAIAKFRAVLLRDSVSPRAWLGLARCYIAKASWSDAIASARRALELSPQAGEMVQTFLQALFGGGTQALTSGNFADAIKHFSEYLKLNTGNPAAWVNAGKAYLGNRQFGDGLQSLVKALGVAGVDRNDAIGTIFSGGMQAFNQRDYSSAINMFKSYVQQDPRNPQAYMTLAKSYWESGQKGGALEAVRDLLKISPTNGEALQMLRQLL